MKLKTNYITVSTDASNRGNAKMMSVLAQFFIPTSGVRIKILQLSFEKGVTSTIIANLLMRTADELQIKDKFVDFCADN